MIGLFQRVKLFRKNRVHQAFFPCLFYLFLNLKGLQFFLFALFFQNPWFFFNNNAFQLLLTLSTLNSNVSVKLMLVLILTLQLSIIRSFETDVSIADLDWKLPNLSFLILMLFLHLCDEIRDFSLLLSKGSTLYFNIFYIFFDTLDAFFHEFKLKTTWIGFHFFYEVMFFNFSLLKL